MNRSIARWSALATFVIGLITLACTATNPETGRQSLNFMTPREEAALGLTEFNKLKQTMRISTDPQMNEMVQNVGNRLKQVIPMEEADWEFVVFEDPSPNAFALPGGKVGVHTGLFPIAQNEAGLAAVIGHEIGHVVGRHSGNRVSQQMVAGGVAAGAAYVLNQGDRSSPIGTAAVAGGALLATRNFSRNQELEADKMGANFMARAGYDPRESVSLWQRFAAWRQSSGSANNTPAFLRTHPVDEVRIQELQAHMPEAMGMWKR
ncbi:MAG: M48 family metallopeptidase [Verrucomicrobiota bacterium]